MFTGLPCVFIVVILYVKGSSFSRSHACKERPWKAQCCPNWFEEEACEKIRTEIDLSRFIADIMFVC